MQIEIYKVLGLNKLQYINMVDGQFNIWCAHLSNVFYVPMRELQKNTKLYNWFVQQWTKRIVNVFLEQNQEYILAGVQDSKTYFDLFIQVLNSPYSMHKVYPSAIVKNIKQEHYKSLQDK